MRTRFHTWLILVGAHLGVGLWGWVIGGDTDA